MALRAPLSTGLFSTLSNRFLYGSTMFQARSSGVPSNTLSRALPTLLALPQSFQLKLPSLLSDIWESVLRAVPKKKTSHRKKRQRFMAGKGLKDVTALNKCPACGNVKRMHLLCPYCVRGMPVRPYRPDLKPLMSVGRNQGLMAGEDETFDPGSYKGGRHQGSEHSLIFASSNNLESSRMGKRGG
jgi:large subunit ribosomal protein L32